LGSGLTATLFLHDQNFGQWSDEAEPGQLHGAVSGRHVHVLVWTSPDLPAQAMRREIGKWMDAIGSAADLLVVCEPSSGHLDAGAIKPGARGDVREPDGEAQTRTESCIGPVTSRRAFACPLGEVENHYPWEEEHQTGLLNHIAQILTG